MCLVLEPGSYEASGGGEKVMGRQSTYTQEIADIICERMSEGNSLLSICDSDDMPCMSTVFKWLTQQPTFAENYTRAMAARADAKFELLDQVSEDAAKSDSATTIAGLRLKSDNLKWQLARMNSKKYGDKLAIGGANDLPPIKLMDDDELDKKIALALAKNGQSE
jgi:hypothetical protein